MTTGRRILPLVLLVLLLAATAPMAAARPAPLRQEAPVPSTLVDASTWVSPGDDLVLRFETAAGNEATQALVEIHAPVDSVGELDAALGGDPGRRLYASPPIPLGFVPAQPDGTREVRVEISPTDRGDLTARLPTAGVHTLTVTLSQPDGTESATERRPLIRLDPDDPTPAIALALVVDVGIEPSVGADGTRTLASADLARLDRLRTYLEQLDTGIGEAPAVTLAVVPDALDALTASTDPRATRIVDVLTALGPRHLALGLPYVPLSAQALLDAGLGRFLPDLVALGRGQLDERLAATIDPTTWPAITPLRDDGVEALGELGVQRLLVAAPRGPADDPRAEPLAAVGPRRLTGLDPLTGIVFDVATAEHLLSPGDAGTTLAELVLRAGSTDGTTTVAIRIDDVPDDAALRALVPLLAQPGAPVVVGGLPLVAEEVPAGAPAFDPPPDVAVDGLGEVASLVLAVDAAVSTFAQTVAGESARAVDLRLRVATALAAPLDADERRALLDGAAVVVDEAFAALSLEGQTDLNLTSRSGTLPLELHNDAGFPMKVVVIVRSDRLRFPQGDRFEVVLEEEITRFDVPVEARATGSVPTFVTMTTPDGSVRLDMRQLNVRSTAVSGVGLALSIGALAVLVLWWGRSWWRGRVVD